MYKSSYSSRWYELGTRPSEQEASWKCIHRKFIVETTKADIIKCKMKILWTRMEFQISHWLPSCSPATQINRNYSVLNQKITGKWYMDKKRIHCSKLTNSWWDGGNKSNWWKIASRYANDPEEQQIPILPQQVPSICCTTEERESWERFSNVVEECKLKKLSLFSSVVKV